MTEPLAAGIRRNVTGTRWHFVRHLVEMIISMHVGMAVGGLLFSAALGGEAREQHAVVWLLAMSVSMTVPMVAWMRYRGHSWRNGAEMAAVMIVPALPLVALNAVDVMTEEGSGAYMNASMIAMVALIVYRRRQYRAIAAHT